MLKPIQFFGPDSEPKEESYDSRVLENFYVVVGAEGARSKFLGKCTPGFGSPLCESSFSKGRAGGLHEYRGRLFAVLGNTFCEIDSSYNIITLGTLASAIGPVSIDSFQGQIMVVDGVLGYIYRVDDNIFTAITDPNFPPSPTQVTAIDNYFISTFDGSEVFAISDLGDGLSWATSQTATAEGQPDLLEGCRAFNKYLWLFGTQTIEIRQDTGDTFPFSIVPGVSLQIGCVSRHTIADSDSVTLSQPMTFGRKVSGGIFWLGMDAHGHKRVYVSKGLQVEVISDYSIETWIASYSTEGCYAFCYALGGTSFYCLTFPMSNATWCFDITGETGWHRRTSFNDTLMIADCWRAMSAVPCFDKIIINDAQSGNLYSLSSSEFSEDGTYIRRRVRGAVTTSGTDQIGTVSRFILELAGSAGLESGQGELPQVMLRMRMDRQWQKERWVTVSVNGDYMQRAKWSRLGGAREIQAEAIMTDPVDWTLIGASAEINSSDNS